MSLPGNGIFVVQGEMSMLVTAMRRSTRWGSHSFPNEEYDVLMRTFQDLKIILNQVDDLRLLDPATYLSPFLEVIRSKETTGPVTSLALSAIHKFLSYGLIDPTHASVPATVEDIADAVTHARFVGTDHSSDGVVLMKILQVLRTLMLSPEGAMLTDESVCEIMLSCFRICFETRLTELLRRNAEQCLRDMTQLIFMRLPQFPPEDASAANFNTVGLSLKKKEKTSKKKGLSSVNSTSSLDRKSPLGATGATSDGETDAEHNKPDLVRHTQDKHNIINEEEITIEPSEPIKSPTKKHGRHSSMDLANNTSITQLLEKCVSGGEGGKEREGGAGECEKETAKEAEPTQPEETSTSEIKPSAPQEEKAKEEQKSEKETEQEKLEEYVNDRGVRFTPQEEVVNLQPYGLACVRELFRFLISLCNPLDSQNTSAMVHLGLCLVGTSLEVAADQIAKYPSLLYLVRDPLCRNLLSLLNTERISIFALDLQISFLLFEALRFHLKYQMEAFFKKLIEIISADTTKAIYELKEIQHLALESLAQMFRIPGLCTELYLNYDCDVYCMNVFEEVTKLLSKNVVSSTAYNIHSLSLEALMTIIEAIELSSNNSQSKIENKSEKETEIEELVEQKEIHGRGGHISLELGGLDDSSVLSDHVTCDISQYFGCVLNGRHKLITELPTDAELDNIRNMKKWVTQGTELFNQKPERGIEFLQEHGVLATPLDPHEVAAFLRENPDLDKKMIGEYICKRSSRGEDDGPSVLGAFADSFDFAGLRIEQALRMYLETFRLPGEAPLIFLVMERFAERWHTTNGEPFANTDAAFRLAYAVIMLNMDQHNYNARKLNVPMTAEDFVKNLRGCNGSGDFDQSMLEQIYYSIKNEEMVMPAERVGPVRDAYLWRVLQRRGAAPAARYRLAPPHNTYYAMLFAVACPPTVTALSAAFERSPAPTQEEIDSNSVREGALLALNGLERCAALVSRVPADGLTIDTILLTLCKFTGLLAPQNANYIAIGVTLGQSVKAQLALSRACAVCARHADGVRAAWRHLLEITRTLYVARLLPKCLVEAEDYLAPNGTVSLLRDAARAGEAGLLSSIYSYIALGETGVRTPTPHEKVLIDAAAECVNKCNLPALLVTETKFLHVDSLQELIRAMVAVGSPADAESLQLNPQLEDITIFFLELLGQTLIQNRDRVLTVWVEVSPYLDHLIRWSCTRSAAVTRRAVTALLRICARLMRCANCAQHVLKQLNSLFALPYKLFLQQADVISCGLYELIKTSAQNVHSTEDWNIVFSLLCAAGAGAWPKSAALATVSSTSSRSEGSEDECDRRPTSVSSDSELSTSPHTQGWIMVKNESDCSTPPHSLDMDSVVLRPHRSTALVRCCEAMSLVVRDVAHVTPYNCRAAIAAVRLLVSATLHSAKKPSKNRSNRKSRSSRRHNDDSSDEETATNDHYHMVSIQLLDLMHTLHSRTAQIFKWWRDETEEHGAEDYDLWEVAWKPLLQGIAQFCTDRRKQVANSAIAYLQRALLAPGLCGLGAAGWEGCFHHVLFPLLQLQRLPHHTDTVARANTIMCKVFLQHLSALSSRPSFPAVWSRVVSVQRELMSRPDEPLTEAALESLKNMILVMDSVRIFKNGDDYNDLWYMTWEKIGEFLPNLKEELFPQVQDNTRPATNIPSHMQPPIPSSLPALVPVGQALPPVGQVSSSPGQIPSPVGQAPSPVGQVPTPVGQAPSPTLCPIPIPPKYQTGFPQMGQQLHQMPQQLTQMNPQLGIQYPQMNQHISQTGQVTQMNQQLAQMRQQISQMAQQDMQTTQVGQESPQTDRQYLQGQVTLTGQQVPQMIQQVPQMNQQIPQNFVSRSIPIQISTSSHQMAHSPPNVGQTLPNFGQTPSSLGHTPPQMSLASTLPAPTPISELVSIRNTLYDQGGLASSVLLRPLNEMISTPIGIGLQSQIPILYPQASEPQPLIQTIDSEPQIQHATKDNINVQSTDNRQPNVTSVDVTSIDTNQITRIENIQSPTVANEEDSIAIIDYNATEMTDTTKESELYAEYLNDPYNETKISTKEATLYEPPEYKKSEEQKVDNDQDNLESGLVQVPAIISLEKQKSSSEHTTPMHRNKAQFGSSDNLKQESSSIFNFASYFSTNEKGSEVFDSLMSSREG